MGIMFAKISFEEHVPPFSDICSQITEICGLPVIVLGLLDDKLYDLHAAIAFECAQDVTLELIAYRQGAVGQFCEDACDEERILGTLLKNVVQGANEPIGTQSIYLRGYLGQDTTLMNTTKLALESLGGIPTEPISDEDQSNFGRTICKSELRERHNTMKREMQKVFIVNVLMLPLLIPFMVVSLIWFLITMPFRLWQSCRTWNRIKREEHKTA